MHLNFASMLWYNLYDPSINKVTTKVFLIYVRKHQSTADLYGFVSKWGIHENPTQWL